MTSRLKKWDKDIDYNLITQGDQLYDIYSIKLTSFAFDIVENMTDYKQWQQAEAVHMIQDVNVDVNVSLCLEPLHANPDFPSMEVFVSVLAIDVFFSDWVMHSINRIKAAILPSQPDAPDGPESQPTEDEVDDLPPTEW